ncbi:MAG: aminoacyl-tRNA hydrolase [Planctomycetes bacterium]|nr:aminoacyl-tRNA hydrolase [Planctomycetota bacterium]
MPDRDTEHRIKPGLVIPRRETWVEFSHAPGPGGQNINKVATAVTLCFCPDSSSALSPRQKEILRAKLGSRINSEGVLRVAVNQTRSQSGNRSLAEERFRELLAEALKPVKKRRPTRPSRAAVEKRLTDKRLRSARKGERGKDAREEA